MEALSTIFNKRVREAFGLRRWGLQGTPITTANCPLLKHDSQWMVVVPLDVIKELRASSIDRCLQVTCEREVANNFLSSPLNARKTGKELLMHVTEGWNSVK